MGKLVPYAIAAGLVAGLGITVASPRAAADAEQLLRSAEVSFSLYALGAKGMEIGMTMRRDGESLQTETALRTAGILDLATRFTLSGTSTARIADDRYVPTYYTTQSDGTWSKRAIRMSWGADGLPIAEVSPPNDEDDRDEVPDLLKANTLDPTTAVMARLLKPGPDGKAAPNCTGMDAIYDGRRRYNLHYTALGPDTVKPHNRTAYSGPAYKCQSKVEPVAGYSRKYLAEWSEKDEQPTYIWLVQPPGYDIWIPVQMEASGRLGPARAWITGARLNGRDWLQPLGLIRAELPKDNN